MDGALENVKEEKINDNEKESSSQGSPHIKKMKIDKDSYEDAEGSKENKDSTTIKMEIKTDMTKEEAMEDEKDMSKPLSIETKFVTPLPSAPSSENTDTASEIGSGFGSPGSIANSSCQSSPQFSDGNSTTGEIFFFLSPFF